MAERNAWIEPGGYLVIDVRSWVGRRTGGTEPELTADLHEWAHQCDEDVRADTDGPAGPRP